ncbi:MAG TPA: hypothetical protein VFX28_02670, partial [Methylomirabilota bacterium]|nr:hypothetical protein [Methylomirabilota bacterium]
DTVRHLLLQQSRRQPLLVVVEDLHWIDRTSEDFFASLAQVVAGARILVVTTYRSGYRPPWIGRSYATQIALQPLAPEHSGDLLRAALGGAPAAEELVRLVLAKAEGNPFFIEEMARVLREQGSAGVAVPDTVEEVLRERMDRLPARERALLQSAAVIGRDVPLSLLRAVAELDDAPLREALRTLEAGEFLYETSLVPEAEYTFKHGLTHEVAYATAPAERRTALHARIVTVLESAGAERAGDRVEWLAHHALRGGLWEAAVRYLRRAGVRAAARSANREAVACFEQALEALGRLPQTPQTLAQAIDLRFDLRTALLPLGELPRILERMHEAEALAERLGDRRRLGQLSTYLTNYHFMTGDPQ